MRSYIACASLLAACALSSVVSAQPASSPVLERRAALPQQVRQAVEQFEPVTEADVREARGRLLSAAARLDRYLRTGGANGASWNDFLRLNEMVAELSKAEPDLGLLAEIYDRYRSGHEGFELPIYSDVGHALDVYLEVASAAGLEDAEGAFQERVESLAADLEAYANGYGPGEALAIGQTLGQWQATERNLPLVREIRRDYSFSNLYVAMSDRLLGVGIEGGVAECAPVRDNILGTSITGTSYTLGSTDVRLSPSADRGAIEILFRGNASSRTTGYNGPAIIQSRGQTSLWGRKLTLLDDNGLVDVPAQASATTNTTILGVGANRSGIGSRLIQKVATKRVYESKSQAERIASSHAAARLSSRLNSQAATSTRQANRQFRDKLQAPLRRRGLYPARVNFASTNRMLLIRALQADPFQLGAPTRPPKADSAADLNVRVHESMANNIAAATFSGLTLTEEGLRRRMIEWFGEVPPELATNEEQEPWSITFADGEPITTRFTDGGFEVTIHGRRFTSGERSFPAMNISARYTLDNADGVLRAVRQGELEIFPPDFDAENDRLNVRQQSLRRLLERRFGRIFKEELVGEGLVMPGRWARAGRLNLVEAKSGRGWMVLGWLKPPRSAARTVAAK